MDEEEKKGVCKDNEFLLVARDARFANGSSFVYQKEEEKGSELLSLLTKNQKDVAEVKQMLNQLLMR